MNEFVMHDEKFRNFFDELKEYVVLRNHNFIDALKNGSDIDILIKDKDKAEIVLIKNFGKPLWYANRSYVSNYFYSWGQIDLIPNIQWRGAEYIRTDFILSEAVISEFGYKQPHILIEATISWLTSILWGGFFKQKYQDLILNAAKIYNTEFENMLVDTLGKKWGRKLFQLARDGNPEESEKYYKQIRAQVMINACRKNFLKTIFGWFNFWFKEIRLRLNPPLPWFAILGPDGCGKSSVLDLLIRQLSMQPFEIKVFHWRPGFLKGNKVDSLSINDPHSKPPRNFFVSILKLFFLAFDWILGYWGHIVNRRIRKKLVIFDRYFIDLFIDPKRYRYGAPIFLAKLFYRVIPKPDYYFLLNASPEVLQSRKQEVSFEESKRQSKEYFKLINSLSNGYIVDSSKSLEEIVSTLSDFILNFIKQYTENKFAQDKSE